MSDTSQDSGYRAVRGVLQAVARKLFRRLSSHGLEGQHHYSLTFRTDLPGVGIPSFLAEAYPSEMTIILQHRFRDLQFSADELSVTLSFNAKDERITIPLEAITKIIDPSTGACIELAPALTDHVHLTKSGEMGSVLPSVEDIIEGGVLQLAIAHCSLFPAHGTNLSFVVAFQSYDLDTAISDVAANSAGAELTVRIAKDEALLTRWSRDAIVATAESREVSIPLETIVWVGSAAGLISRGQTSKMAMPARSGVDPESRAKHREELIFDVLQFLARTSKSKTDGPSPNDGSSEDQSARIAIPIPILSSLIVGGAYLVAFVVLYLIEVGADTNQFLCIALMKIDPACPGQSSNIEILRGLLRPTSPHVLPLILLLGVRQLATAAMAIALERELTLKKFFNSAIVAQGFFFGYILTAIIISLFYRTPLFASGYAFAVVSFLYVYLLYLAVFHAKYLMPRARTYEVEYGFIFDSLFSLVATGIIAVGFAASVDVVLSGIIFIIASFAMMLLANTAKIGTRLRFLYAQELAEERLVAAQAPRNLRTYLSKYWEVLKEVRRMPREDLDRAIDARIKGEGDLPAQVAQGLKGNPKYQIGMGVYSFVKPIIQYFILRFILGWVLS